jgi:hypothetical protein
MQATQAKKETCPHCGNMVELDDRPGQRGMLRAHLAEPLQVGCKGSGGVSIELERAMATKGQSLLDNATSVDDAIRERARASRFR